MTAALTLLLQVALGGAPSLPPAAPSSSKDLPVVATAERWNDDGRYDDGLDSAPLVAAPVQVVRVFTAAPVEIVRVGSRALVSARTERSARQPVGGEDHDQDQQSGGEE
jgi:hypothetical protein